MLELFDRRGRFAEHAGPEDERGVPGRHLIESGVVGFGLDVAENRRLQAALAEANVLHRVAELIEPDLESPCFNGIRVYYGGAPGAVQAEVLINGERHAAASAALAGLGLPEPAVWTAVRYFALLLPLNDGTPGYPCPARELRHAHTGTCRCGNELDPRHPGRDIPLPHLVAELSAAERAERVRVHTEAILVADGVGNFLRVRLPVRLTDGRTLVYRAWVYLHAPVMAEVDRRWHSGELAGHRFEGLFCNAVEPWGTDLLRAPVVIEGRPVPDPESVGVPEIVASSHPVLRRVLEQQWPADVVLPGDDGP